MSCFNRHGELLRWSNGRRKPPSGIAATLHPAWAVLAGIEKETAAVEFFAFGQAEQRRRRPSLVEVFSEHASLAGTPRSFRLPDGRILIWAIVGSEPELRRICARLLPEHRIDQAEVEPSFSEFNRASIDPSWWLRDCAAPCLRSPKSRPLAE